MADDKPYFKVPYTEDENQFSLGHSIAVIRGWRAKDTYPWMRRRTVNFLVPRCAFWLSVLTVAVHAWWASVSHCGVDFQRGGAVVVLLSAAGYGLVSWHEATSLMVNKLSPFHPLFMLPLLGVVGTLLWGYGDLLPFFGTACR